MGLCMVAEVICVLDLDGRKHARKMTDLSVCKMIAQSANQVSHVYSGIIDWCEELSRQTEWFTVDDFSCG